jgi:plasmid stabilization system protein ParE
MARVIISDSAIRRIRKIHSYYSKKVSHYTADKIVNEIFSTIRYLETQPLAWQEEEYLKKLRKGHRRIVSGNYKITYRVQESCNGYF